MKKMIVLAVLLFSFPVFAVKIACVDMKRIWESSDEIKVEKKRMESMLKKSQNMLKAKEKELMQLQERAKNEAAIATEEAKRAMAEEYQKKMLEYQQLYQENQKKLQDKDVKAQADFIEKVKKIASRIAKRKGYDIVLAKEQVLFVSEKYDITYDVLKVVNKKK